MKSGTDRECAPRVAHIVTSLNQGGAQSMLVKLLSALRERFDMHVVSLTDEGWYGQDIRRMGMSLHCLGMERGALNPLLFFRLSKVLGEIMPDVVQAWMYHGNLAASIAALAGKGSMPVIWNVRQSLYDVRLEKKQTRMVIRAGRVLAFQPDKIIYNSAVASTQHEGAGFPQNKSVVIPNGVDMNLFHPSEEMKEKICREIGMAEDALIVGHVARFHPMKDHAGFFAVASDIALRNDRVFFLLLGSGVSFDNEEISSLVPGQLRERFHLLGVRQDVHRFMAAMDVFCLSSLWGEAFPNVLLEAMACGVPCVTTDVGDSAHIVGEFGSIVKPGDYSALRRGIEHWLALSEKGRKKVGEKARAHVCRHYALQSVVEAYADLYGRHNKEKHLQENR